MNISTVPNLRAVQSKLADFEQLADLNHWYENFFTSLDASLPAPRVCRSNFVRLRTTVADLLAFDAEAELAQALKEFPRPARHNLSGIKLHVLAVDYTSRPTERFISEMYFRCLIPASAKQGRLFMIWWSDHEPSQATVKIAAREAVFRHHAQCTYGSPETLADMMKQEGLVQAYGGRDLTLADGEMEAAANIIRDHLDSTHYRQQFSCLFGDAIAKQLDYPGLGLAERAGFELALSRAISSRVDPLTFHETESALTLVS